MSTTTIREKRHYSVISLSATAIDFGLLLLLTYAGFGTVRSNYVSSSIGFICSFSFNKRFIFRQTTRRVQSELLLYLVFTLIGIWALQPIIIHLVEPMLRELSIANWQVVTAAKLIASLVTFGWNYIFYTRVVFRRVGITNSESAL